MTVLSDRSNLARRTPPTCQMCATRLLTSSFAREKSSGKTQASSGIVKEQVQTRHPEASGFTVTSTGGFCAKCRGVRSMDRRFGRGGTTPRPRLQEGKGRRWYGFFSKPPLEWTHAHISENRPCLLPTRCPSIFSLFPLPLFS